MQSEHESGTKGLRENFLYRLKAAFGRVRGLAAGPPLRAAQNEECAPPHVEKRRTHHPKPGSPQSPTPAILCT